MSYCLFGPKKIFSGKFFGSKIILMNCYGVIIFDLFLFPDITSSEFLSYTTKRLVELNSQPSDCKSQWCACAVSYSKGRFVRTNAMNSIKYIAAFSKT